MAYLKPEKMVFIANNGKPITCFINSVAFRKYIANVTDRKTGEKKKKRKSMPYAICEVKVSSEQGRELSPTMQISIAEAMGKALAKMKQEMEFNSQPKLIVSKRNKGKGAS